MPYVEQAGLKNLVDPKRSFSDRLSSECSQGHDPHVCLPSDIGLQTNEWETGPGVPIRQWARVRGNYVVNAGNTVYGQHDLNAVGSANYVPFGGAPFAPVRVTPLAKITDGTANTLMMSEVIVLPSTVGWGGPYSDIQTALGGQVFTGWQIPNSAAADALARTGEWLSNE